MRLIRFAQICVLILGLDSAALAIDRILTIGGGYAPEGNQASLEANVLFFQKVLATSHSQQPFTHRIQLPMALIPSPTCRSSSSAS